MYGSQHCISKGDNMKKYIPLHFSFWLLAFITAGADAEDRSPSPRRDEDTVLRIADEIPGAAERVLVKYLTDPEVTQRSYANVTIRGCSGTMIGPNILLTAAHCGAEWFNEARFLAYFDGSTQRQESYTCRYLIHGWPEHDAALAWCDPANGINPGDRWGYVDMDIDVGPCFQLLQSKSQSRISVGRGVYSVWSNKIDTFGSNDQLLVSNGSITSTTANTWFNPGGDACSNEDDDAIGVHTDVYGIPGASGSTHLSSRTHRILLGSNSLAPGEGGQSRYSAAVFHLLTRASLTTNNTTGQCADRYGPQVNVSLLQELWDRGIRFDADRDGYMKYYNNPLDSDANGIFDVMQDLEASTGEARRSFYYLGMESVRRNALWTRSGPTEFIVGIFNGHLQRDLNPNWYTLVNHNKLNLDPSKTYWLRYRARSTNNAELQARFGSHTESHSMNGSDDMAFVQRAQGGPISFAARGNGTITISDVTVFEEGSQMTFDYYDERKVWKRSLPPISFPFFPFAWPSEESERAAYIIPNGRQSQTSVDWAGLVSRRKSFWPFEGYDERLLTSALTTPKGYFSVCFDHRLFEGAATIGHGRLIIGGVENGLFEFEPTIDWQRQCTAWLGGTKVSASSLTFTAELSAWFRTYRYLVDNVSMFYSTSEPIRPGSTTELPVLEPVTDGR
jgi:hypothetical protein